MERLTGINTEFHDLLYDLSRSPRLIRMINGLRDQIFRFRKIILKRKMLAKVSNEDHKRMLAAMRKRDGDRVERLVKKHILRGRKLILKELENRTGEF
jgi:DNA-binding GntR family transcriptional regulator